MFLFHSICVLEEQLIFCHGSSQCYVVGGPSPPISQTFDMKADDVVPTFVLLNIFRANLGQHVLIGNNKNKLTQVNFFNDLTAFAECVLPFVLG